MRENLNGSANGRRARPPASPRDLADLARAGYVIQRQPLMQVTFEVHHIADRPGYLADYLASGGGRRTAKAGEAFGETLTTGAHGLGLVVVTRTAVGVGKGRQYRSGQTQCQVTEDAAGRIFRGVARPNPSFIYESAWRYEGLICVDPDATRVQVWHSRAIRDVIHEVARLAKDSEAPILSLQAPAQIPPDDSVMRYITPEREEDMLPAATSLAVRFAIAIQHPDAATVLGLSERLARYCSMRGFGLWLADTRLGSRPGNWSEICEYNTDPRISRPTDRTPDSAPVKRSLPITLVGPARVGATFSLLSFLCQYKEIGVAACSVISLDDLLFINLQLTFADTPAEVLLAVDKMDAESYSADLPSDVLIRILQKLGRDRLGDHERAGMLVNNAGDYQCLVGPTRRVVHNDMRRRIAIWFSWQAQGSSIDLATPLARLLGAAADAGLATRSSDGKWSPDAPNIDYLVCRNMGNSVLRGKGKLSVLRDIALRNYADDDIESRPTNLCVSIEEAWRASAERDGRRGVRELTVAWRECWLGHWSLPI